MPNIITITLDAETGKLTSAMKGVDQTVKKTKTSTLDFVKTHKAAFLAVTAAITGAVLAMKKIIDSTTKYATELDRLAKTTGLTVQQTARLRYAIEQEHGSLETFSVAIVALSRRMAEAQMGNLAYAKAFQTMGITIEDVNGNVRSANEVFLEMADYMQNTESQAKRVALADIAMSEAGRKLVPILSMGREEIQKLGDEAERLGLVMSVEEVAAFKKFDDSLTRARGALRGIFISISQELIPVLENFVNWLTENSSTIRKAFDIIIKIVRTWVAIQMTEMQIVWEIYSWFWDRIKWFITNMVNIFKEGFSTVAEGLGDFGGWLSDWAEFALSKLKFWKEEDIQPPPIGDIWQAEFDKVWLPFEEEGLQERILPLTEALRSSMEEIWAAGEEGTQAVVQANQETFQAAGAQTRTMAQQIAENLRKSIATTVTFISNLMLAFTEGTSRALADLIVDGKNFGESMKEVFKGLIKSAIAYIAKLLIIKALTRALGFPFEKGGEVPGFKHGGQIPKFQAGGEVPIIAHVGEYIVPADMVKQIRRQREIPLGLLSGIITGSPPRMQAGGMVSPTVDVGGINVNVTALPQEPTESLLNRISEAVEEGVSSAIDFSKRTYNTGLRFAGEAV